MRNVFKLAVCVVVLLFAGAVEGQTTLTGGRVAKFNNVKGSKPGKAVLKFVRDAAISEIENPSCPNDISLRIVASNGYDVTTELPCGGESEGWKAISNGFKYIDKEASVGGIKKIKYKAGMLMFKIKGSQYEALAGPLTEESPFVEVSFNIGDTSYCGRFDQTPPKNDVKKILFRGPSGDCEATEPPGPVEVDCPDGYECAVFEVEEGPGDLKPTDDGEFSWFRILNFTTLASTGTSGEFSRGPIVMARGTVADPNDKVELILPQTAYVGAPRPVGGGGGQTCWRIEQDPNAVGWLDCNGGSPDDVELTVNSHGTGDADPPTLNVGTGDPGVAGAGLLRVIVSTLETEDLEGSCSEAEYSNPGVQTAFTIGTATATVLEPRQPGQAEVTLSGKPFDCANWGSEDAGVTSIAAPLYTLDVYVSIPAFGIDGTYDIPAVLRLKLDSQDASAGEPVCGDGVIGGDEECDDGDPNSPVDPNSVVGGDGCSTTCTVEDGWECEGEPSTCTELVCGDGTITASLGEECDDGEDPPDDGDGCSATCTVESGWECEGEPSDCAERYCGDGVITGWLSEECDDGEYPPDDGDGCSDTCTVEDGYICTGQPSVCTSASDLCPPAADSCAAFNIRPGPGNWQGVPGDTETFFQLFDFPDVGMSNVTDGQWGPSPIMLARWPGGGLTWIGDSYLGATLNTDIQELSGTGGTVCLHIRQDPTDTGWLDCAGGTEPDVHLSVDSNFAGPDDPPVLTIPDGSATGAAGTGVIRVEMQVVLTTENGTDCNGVNYSGAQVVKTAFTTHTATSELLQPVLSGLGDPNVDQVLTMSGLELNCGTWGTGDGSISSIAAPLFSLGFPAPLPGNPPVDVAMLARFELAQTDWPTGDEECGNGVLEAGEFCDDGDLDDGDGCSATCTVESGWVCTGEPSTCRPIVCGDGFVEGTEQCDDGVDPPADGDGCSATCTVENGWSCVGEPSTCSAAQCGDGYWITPELCDDGDTDDGDGCSASCTVEVGWTCAGSPTSICDPICGDAMIVGPEQCDDGEDPPEDGDGCSSTCTIEDLWDCFGEPSVCGTCGDSSVLAGIGEECDDGNTSNGDCCSGACEFEPEYSVCTGDGNVCTDDYCDGNGTCLHVNNNNGCDDGSDCTVDDICSGGDCVADFIDPWINEVDYNSEADGSILGGNPQSDYEEYVEIAGPAGMDIGGYHVVDIDGRGRCCSTNWLGACDGYCDQGAALFALTLPGGSVLTDDTGTGIGFFTVCIDPTSFSSVGGIQGVGDAGNCDYVFSWGGSSTASNLARTGLENNGKSGVLLYPPNGLPLNPGSSVLPVDGVSWAGYIEDGPYQSTFLALSAPNTGVDPGNGTYIASTMGKPNVYSCPGRSLANLSSDLSRNTDEATWSVTSAQGDPFDVSDDSCGLDMGQPPGYAVPAHTPGTANPGQSYSCGIVPQVCGDGMVQYGEDCEDDSDCALLGDFICAPPGDPLECACVPNPPCGNGIVDPGEECDEGEANSNEPDATCREDCTAAGCGDGIIDPGYGEDCEGDSDCGSPDVCFECACGDPPMGLLNFTVIPGPSAMDTCDSAQSILSTHGGPTGGMAGLVCNGTAGDFTEGPIALFGGRPDAGTGIASLRVDSAVVIKAHLDTQKPGCGGECVACWRFEQDPENVGFVDCDGGSSTNAVLQVNSDAGNPPAPPIHDAAWLTVGSGGNDGAGAAVVRVIMKNLTRNSTGLCPTVNDPLWASTTGRRTALVTGQARATIDNPLRCPGDLGGVGCPDANPYQVVLTGANFNCSSWNSNSGAALVVPNFALNEQLGGPLGEGDIAQVLKLAD